MKLIPSHRSALRIWRSVRLGKFPLPTPLPPKAIPSLDRLISSNASLRAIAEAQAPRAQGHGALDVLLETGRDDSLSQAQPFDVLVTDRQSRHPARSIRHHLATSPLPPESLCLLFPGVYLPTPEYLLLQLAEELSEWELLAVAYELCGSYVIDPRLEFGFMPNVDPVSSQGKLRDYCQGARGKRNIRKVRAVCSMLHDGSASPRESDLATALSYPLDQGGFWMGSFQMNVRESFAGFRGYLAGGNDLYPDILFDARPLVVEYDSRAFHGTNDKADRDKDRADGLRAAGYEVVTFTNLQFSSLDKFVQGMARVGSYMGVDVLGPGMDPEIERARCRLLTWMRNPHHQPL